MIKPIHEKKEKLLEIDLTGSEGNAHVLLGYARSLGKELKWSKRAIDIVVTMMMAGDYENLLEVFDHHFGDFVILYR